jgi:hypothetical protein
MAQVVEYLPSKCKALNSNLNTIKEKKNPHSQNKRKERKACNICFNDINMVFCRDRD